ncbi:hypothetical protein ACFL9U_13795 [Thermodesulfobacteriota bacterium]
MVEPPDYQPPEVVGDLEAPAVALPTFDLADEKSGVFDGIFEGTYGDFTYNGDYRIVFYARDAEGLVNVSPPTLVTVTGGADLVTSNAGPDQTVDEGALVTLDGSSSSGTIESYGWVQTAGISVDLSNDSVMQPTFIAPEVGVGGESLTFELTVTDDIGRMSTDSVTVHIANVVLAGDIDDSGNVDLADAVLALKIACGMDTSGETIELGADVDGDGKIGIKEVIYIIQEISGLR